jgi:hypothetical protein
MKNPPTYGELDRAFEYDPETGVLRWKIAGGLGGRLPAGRVAGCPDRDGFLKVGAPGRRTAVAVHRIAWCLMTGSWPKRSIGHANGDHSDNRWCNLREANSRGVRHVVWVERDKRWRVQKNYRGKNYLVGRYRTLAEAIRVRNVFLREAGFPIPDDPEIEETHDA